jgi:hypothetical protein
MKPMIVDQKTQLKFYAVKTRNLDLYPQFKQNMFVQVSHMNEVEDTVYLREEDYLSYCSLVDIDPSKEDYVSRLEEAYTGALVLLRKKEVSPSALSLCQKVSECIQNLSLVEGAGAILSKLSKSPEIKKHMLRTLFCRILTNRLQWTNPSNLQKIFMASLLAQIYESPDESANALEKIGLSSDIILAIRHHKENNDGSGPLKVKKHYIYSLAKVIRVSDELAKLFMEKKKPDEIRRALSSMSPEKLDSQVTKIAVGLWS